MAGVAFNNLACAQLPLPQPAGAPAPAPSSGAPQQQAALPPGNASGVPHPLYVEYAPVVYLDSAQSVAASGWTSDPNSFTTFLVRRAGLLWHLLLDVRRPSFPALLGMQSLHWT